MNNMTVWTPATAEVVPSFENDTAGAEGYTIGGHTYYNNILYTEPAYSSDNNQGYDEVKNVELWVYYPETVMLYTGQSSLPEMPIMLKSKDNVNGFALWGYDRYVIACFPVTSSNEPSEYFYLSGDWSSAIGKINRTLDWPWTMSASAEDRGTLDENGVDRKPLGSNAYGEFDTENDYSLLLTPQSGVSEHRAAHANSLVFNGDYFDYPFDEADVGYYDSYMASYYPKLCFVAGQDSNEVMYINCSTPIRILNYKFICDAIENRKSILSQVSDYKEGDLATVISGFDKLTVDPNSFFTSSNEYYNALTNYYSGGVDAYSDPTDYCDRYQAFRDLLDMTNYYGDTPYDIRNYPETGADAFGGYNGVAWAKYKTIYDNALETFNKIITDGYNDSIDDVYNALYSAFLGMTKEGRIDVESAGTIVSMSSNIYTHAAGQNYNYYGQEISDNYNYNANDSANAGERVTYIDVKYPYFISPTNPSAVYCISDQTLPNEYNKGSYLAVAMNEGKWTDGTNTYTDSQVAAMSEADQNNVYMRYYLTGNVSDYYAYRDGKYQEGALQLLINYVNKADYDAAADKSAVKSYGEYEFPYVMANPSMAHQIIGVRNQYNGAASYASRKTATVYFGRFLGSEGKATNLMSNLTFNTAYYDLQQSMKASDSPYKSGTGIFNFLDTFGSNESLYFQDGEGASYEEEYTLPDGTTGIGKATAEVGKSRYSSPLLTSKQFSFMNESDGINSGSFSMVEHDDDGYPDDVDHKNVSTPNTAIIVEVDYYIDYSDSDNMNIKYKTDGTPYYSFELDESNIYWESLSSAKGATSYFNVFGDLANKYNNNDVTIDYATKNAESGLTTFNTSANIEYTWGLTTGYYYTQNEFFLDALGNPSGANNYVGYEITSDMGNTSPYSTRLELLGIDKDLMQTTRTKTDSLNATGAKRAFPELPETHKNSALKASNVWTGSATFTGTDTIKKQTDTTSAETYSNYVLELGTVTKIDNLGFVYTSSEDTYQYYNIGVSTCDKTAIRTFLDKYVNKQLVVDENRNVVLDENGEPTIKTDANHPNGDIKSGDYSYSTYQTYLDAIADIYEFVGNYKDTKIGNTENGNVTAYNSDGTPIYTDTKTGRDILKDQTDITTDEEQIALIQAVVDAYNDLLDIDAYDEFADENKQIIDDIEDDGNITVTPDPDGKTDASGNLIIDVDVADGKYTDDSVEDLSEALTLANAYYNYYKDPDNPEDDKDYWRETPLSFDDYTTLNNIVKSAADALKEKIDNVDFAALIDDKNTTLQGGIGNDYTAKSWFALSDKVDESTTLNQNCYNEDNELKQKYVDDDSTKVSYTFRDVKYEYVNQGTQLSDEQIAIDTDYPLLEAVSLKSVDKDSTYQTFDVVAQVVNDMDRGKYTDEGLALVDSLYHQLMTGEDSTQPSVYFNITQEQQQLYKAKTGQDIDRTKLKATTYDPVTGSETDKLSAQLLDLVNELNDNYSNIFKAYLTVQDQDGNIIDSVDDVQVDEGKYGDVLTIDASSYCADGKSIKWTLTTTNAKDQAIGKSRKLSSFYGTTLELKADANVHATAILTNELPQDVWTVYVYNYYSNVNDVKYVLKSDYPELDTMTGTEIATITGATAAYLPFYTFTEFTSEPVDDSTIKLRPNYTSEKTATVTLGTDSITFGHIDMPITKGTSSVMSKFGTGVTINYTGDDFFAYAAKPEGSDKYRIVSYNSEYQFAAFENETYYVVTYKVAGDMEQGFMIKDGEDLTPANVEGVHIPSGVVRTEQECLNFMIGYKEPFVYTQTYTVYNDGTNDLLRGYFRVTAGSDVKTQAVGVSYLANNVEGMKNIDHIASSGQFTITVRQNGITYKKLPMRAYATYSYTYTFYAYDGTETKQLINTTAYSSWTYDKSQGA